VRVVDEPLGRRGDERCRDVDMDSRLGSFRRHDRPHLPRLVVDGDVDDRLVDDFTDAIFKTISDAHGSVVLDLSGVTYFGSNGIGALITADALAHDHGVELTIEPSRIVRRVLEVTGLADFFGLHTHTT
jgi:anti-anti-sigma factor